MALLVVRRPARTQPPAVPTEAIALAPPPQLPAGGQAGSWLTYLFPVVGSLGSMVFVLVAPNPVYIIGGLFFALSSVGMGVGMYYQQSSGQRGRTTDERARYLDHVKTVRGHLRSAAAAQRAAAHWRHPEPGALWRIAADPTRVWERRPNHPDFLEVRVGRGSAPLAASVTTGDEDDPMGRAEPVGAAAAQALLRARTELSDLPIAIRLAAAGSVTVIGAAAPSRYLLRAIVAQIATLHAPDDVRMAFCVSAEAAPEWEWVKWLPHAEHPDAADGSGPLRLVAADLDGLQRLIGAELRGRRREPGRAGPTRGTGPHLIVITDGPPTTPAGPADDLLDVAPGAGVTVIRLLRRRSEEPGRVDLRLTIDGDVLRTTPGTDGVQPDRLSAAEAETLARRLAPLRLSVDAPEDVLVETLGLPELLRLGDVAELDPTAGWGERSLHDSLRVPIGVDTAGRAVHLDLKESALDGMGPHGLVVGATGSGKSELLRTLVTALAVAHPPETLAFVLVDFKGGATFAGMAALPHVSGVITNLQDDLALVDRFHAALFGEMRRRQELLRSAGNLSNIREYAARRNAGVELEPLPSLLVIVDEFSELLANKPEFIDLFVAIGRLGRSLGLHLLLASQRLDEGRLRGLESHLSYRIGLRTFSAVESRTVLGVPDAYELPPIPGSAYLKVDTTVFQRLRAAMVSGPYRPPARVVAARPEIRSYDLRTTAPEAEASRAFSPDISDPNTSSVMDVVVARLAGAAPRAHQVWLPPLEPAVPLDALLTGGEYAEAGKYGGLAAPIGLVDKPGDQAREPLVVDLAGAAGHYAIVGGPRSGKSTVLRTLITAYAATHSPREIQFYCLDFGGGLLPPLAGLPHVGTVTGRLDPERVRRVVGEVHALLEDRERRFLSGGIDSATTFRTRLAGGELPDERHGDVVLVIDNWPAVRTEFEDVDPLILEIAGRGLGYAVHLVITANRWMDIKPVLRDSLGGRLELRLGETAESDVDRREAVNVPIGAPGRGLLPGKLHVQVALPRLDGVADAVNLPAGTEDAVRRIAAQWPSAEAAAPVRVLPARLAYADLLLAHPEDRGVAIGIGEADLDTVYLDLGGADPHFLVLGDGESGKTNFLRAYAAGLVARRTPEQARVLVVDYRRTLLEAVPESHLLAYAGAAPAANDLLGEVREALTKRLPGADLTPAQLRARSWWTGPEVYVLVDDYDLVVTPTANPLAALGEFLPQARDLGLHVIVARRVGGMARSAYEPVMQRLKELGTPGLLLSGDSAEGVVMGAHRASIQPPGRGLLVRRGQRSLLVQTGWLPPTD